MELLQGKNPTDYGLGLLATRLDPNNEKFPIRKLLKATTKTYKYWNANGWWGDQGHSPECVAFSTVQWLEDSPIVHPESRPEGPPFYDPHLLYSEVQAVDGWPLPHEGSSTLAAMKVLRTKNFINSYHWAYNLQDLIDCVLTLSPCLVGTNWSESMFYPTNKGVITIDGPIAGGHQWIINGVNTKTKMFRGKSSWGKNFTPVKHFYISFDDMDRLIKEQGEISIAQEIKK